MNHGTMTSRPPGYGWLSKIEVDDSSTFFFDHPLDHIPGMLLVDSAMHEAERTAARITGCGVESLIVDAVDLKFNGLCEKDSDAYVSLVEEAGQSGRELGVTVHQDGSALCTGTLRTGTASAAGKLFTRPVRAPESAVRAPSELVHKASAENVLIAPLHRVDEHTYVTEMIAPEAGRWPEVHPVTVLMEAVRQTATLTSHTAWDIPEEWQYILMGIKLAVADTGVWDGTPQLVCHASPLKGRARGGIDIDVSVASTEVGRMHIDARAVPPAAYLRMRDAQRCAPRAVGAAR